MVRVRPLLAHERSKDVGVCVRVQPPETVVLIDPQKQAARTFECSKVFDSSNNSSSEYADQQALYEGVGKRIVDHAAQGYNCCLCAYGQTGTGKTHTIHGDWSSPSNMGLLPRIAEGLFNKVESLRKDGTEVRVQMSYIEIYNNRLFDLLAPAASSQKRTGQGSGKTKSKGNLEIHTHPTIGVYVDNLEEFPVQHFRDVGKLVAIGERAKHMATTSMNTRSSRSHTIFTLKLELRNTPRGEGHRMATVQVVDLAGRENEQSSEATGERFRELTFINRSLFQLANCVSALSDGAEHVPFRNSKLTMLLSESFQHNSRTYLLATLTPSSSCYEENLSTCRFLESTGQITTQPIMNRFSAEELRGQLEIEIDTMRKQLGHSEPKTIAPQLKSRQAILKNITNWSDNEGTEKDNNGKKVAREGDAAIKVACERVAERLRSGKDMLHRLDEANSAVGMMLVDAESRLSAAEANVRSFRKDGKAAPLESFSLPPLVQPQEPSISPKAGGKAGPVVTFSFSLPPIVFESI